MISLGKGKESRSHLIIQNESEPVLVTSGHFGKEGALSQKDESVEGVVEAERHDQMQADDRRRRQGGGRGERLVDRPREPEGEEGKDEEGSAVENGLAPHSQDAAGEEEEEEEEEEERDEEGEG